MIKKNFLKEKLLRQNICLGTWSVIPSNTITDIITSSKFDFVILDQEHGPLSFETIQKQIITSENNNCSPLVRVSKVSQEDILRALDVGAHGIQVPNINNLDDLKYLIEYSKYPPKGNRGFSTFTRAGGYNIKNKDILYSKANDNTLLGINIESKKALDLTSKISEFEEIDIIFYGTFDLVALGKQTIQKFGNISKSQINILSLKIRLQAQLQQILKIFKDIYLWA